MSKQKKKLLDSFKGYLRELKLEPFANSAIRNDPNYSDTFSYTYKSFCRNGCSLILYDHKELKERVLSFSKKLFPDQLDRSFTIKCLHHVAADWAEMHYDDGKVDSLKLKEYAERFYEQIKDGIKDYIVYVPIDGLELKFEQQLTVGKGSIEAYRPTIEFIEVIERFEQYHSQHNAQSFVGLMSLAKSAPSIYTVRVSAHQGQAIRQAIKYTELSLSILRLFMGSYVNDIHTRQIPRQMGVIGTLLKGEKDAIYFRADEERNKIPQQVPGASINSGKINNHILETNKVENYQSCLTYLNEKIIQTENRGTSTPQPEPRFCRQIIRAIQWFSKATTANSPTESFLLLAISLETLLADKPKTTKETYAERIVRLICICSCTSCANRIYSDEEQEECIKLWKRVIELIKIRHKIAHGELAEDEVEYDDLADFEDIVRRTIIYMLDGQWTSLDLFKQSVKEELDKLSKFRESTKRPKSHHSIWQKICQWCKATWAKVFRA